MVLAASARLGPYEIIALLGAGGMGEVYRALDTRLGREVAIKILPADVPASGEWRRRFEREAQAISRLTHPHVCALFDVGREGDVDYLVMELLVGETLGARLRNGPLPFEQVLRFGAQIASALGAAHAVGITHRDLKPGNVMVTPLGIKLLDFGLAKTLPGPAARELTWASTASLALTQEGAVLGTVPYMAPEQLEGRAADARSDIFALGAVLFEMATRRRAFPGESQAAIISAILTSQPPAVSSAQRASPPAFDRLVATCLAKEPAARWSSAHDVELLLRQIEEGAIPGTAGPEASPERRRAGWPWWGIAALLAMGTLATAALLRARTDGTGPAHAIRFALAPPTGAAYFYTRDVNSIAVSPDGSQLAFVATDPNGGAAPQDPTHALIFGSIGRRLWIRRLADLDARPVPTTEGASSVFWSPDGRSVGFFAQGTLKRIDLPDGAAVTICPVESRGGLSGTWGKGGDILFASVQGGTILRVPAAGGTPSIAVQPDAARGWAARWPWFLPDGERFLYLQRTAGNHALMMSVPGRPPRELMTVGSKVQFSEPGVLVFVREGTLLGQRFDWRGGSMTGAPFAIAQQVRFFSQTGAAGYATSAGGTLVFQSSDDVQRLVWLDRSGEDLGPLASSGNYLSLAISPSGRRIAFSRTPPRVGMTSLWSFDLDRDLETRISSGSDGECCPVWLPGEKGLVYAAVKGGSPHLFRRELDTGTTVELLPPGSFQVAQDVSPDGSAVLYLERSDRGAWDLWKAPLSGAGAPSAVLQSPFSKIDARFSPDGRYIAFVSEESGKPEAYIAPVSGPGERIRISRDGATNLRWSRETSEIFYLGPDRRLWLVPVRTNPVLRIGAPSVLFTAKGRAAWSDFDVSADGKRILAVVPEVIADELPQTVVVNWPAEAPN